MDVPAKTSPRLFLIDAYALIYRSFFAFIKRPLVTSKGENTSAPFGFAQFLERVRTALDPDFIAVVWDAGRSFRQEVYPEYKATRERMPDELRASLPRIREICAAYRFPVVELDGYEADDVIGTLAARAEGTGVEAVIVSGDKDFYQLVRPGVRLLNPGRGGPVGVDAEWVDEAKAADKLGVPPERVVDYLALIGDSSDNVPGAPGIGPKTALKLLDRFGTVESVLEHAEEVGGKRARESLLENGDDVRLSKRLVMILTDLDLDVDIEDLRVRDPDADALRDLFVELEFRRLAEVFTKQASRRAPEPVSERYEVVTDAARLEEIVKAARTAGGLSVAVLGSAIDPLRADLVGVGLCWAPGQAAYLPFGHASAPSLALGDGPDGPENLPALADSTCVRLVELLGDASVAKVGHDLKRSALLLRRAGTPLRGLAFDVMVASYVLDPSRRDHGLPALAVDLLGLERIGVEDVTGKGKSRVPVVEASPEAARDLVCQEADYAERLHGRFEPEIEEQGLESLFRDLEMPLVPVLQRMEEAGILIDRAFFETMSERLARDLGLIQDEIFKIAGAEFNLNSTPQLRTVLFEELDLPVIKRTKTGPSTDASVLEELAAMGHDVPRLLMEYRELEKLRSTYVDALPRLIHPDTGRIHTSFNQTVAATGRLSSSDPNLQNIPIRTAVGREIRKGFIAAEGHRLLGVDYSQIELRILAHFSGDEAFVTAFREGIDVHRQTASVIFDVSIDDVTGDMRGQAKTINFATLYGQGAFSLARQLGLSREEAQAFIDQYFERFAGVRAFLDEQVTTAKEHGYVETLMGRRRYIPELRSRNWNIRQFGERVAQNTPIQGTAADLIKKAMLDVDAAIAEREFEGRMLLQVHDELLFEVPEDEVDAFRETVVARMEGAVQLSVPLEADWGVGRSWFEAKG